MKQSITILYFHHRHDTFNPRKFFTRIFFFIPYTFVQTFPLFHISNLNI